MDELPFMSASSPKLTPAGGQVLALAREEAERWQHAMVFTEHLLLGCVSFGKGYAAKVLQDHGLDRETVRLELSRLIQGGPDREPMKRLPFSPKVMEVLASAMDEARVAGRAYIGAEHILLELLRGADGIVARVLTIMKVDIEKLYQELLDGFEPRSSSQRR
jgi:ATP-dependent Clp protease ATP-binding subunit ClpC